MFLSRAVMQTNDSHYSLQITDINDLISISIISKQFGNGTQSIRLQMYDLLNFIW